MHALCRFADRLQPSALQLSRAVIICRYLYRREEGADNARRRAASLDRGYRGCLTWHLSLTHADGTVIVELAAWLRHFPTSSVYTRYINSLFSLSLSLFIWRQVLNAQHVPRHTEFATDDYIIA